jgi:hypothetical protein
MMCGVVFLTLLTAKVFLDPFRSASVCGNCAEVKHTTEWKIPFTDTTFWTLERVSDSTLSLVVKKDRLAPTASHRWLFISGSGNGVMCALGLGERVLPHVNNKYIADFLDCAANHGEKHFAQAWLRLILDPATAEDAWSALLLANFPTGGVSTRAKFVEWWNPQIVNVGIFLKHPVPALDDPTGAATKPASHE